MNWKGMRKLVFACLIFLASVPGFAATVAISTFTLSGLGLTAAHQNLMVDLFTAGLAREKGLRLVERRNLEKVLKEIEFSLSDLVDSNTALRTGKILGAAYILTGSLIGLDGGAFVSVQVIDNTSGAVVLALGKNLTAVSTAALQGFVGESAPKIARRLAAATSSDVDLLWLTKSAAGTAKPILIYIMSTVERRKRPVVLRSPALTACHRRAPRQGP
jgi:TolB-like protein